MADRFTVKSACACHPAVTVHFVENEGLTFLRYGSARRVRGALPKGWVGRTAYETAGHPTRMHTPVVVAIECTQCGQRPWSADAVAQEKQGVST